MCEQRQGQAELIPHKAKPVASTEASSYTQMELPWWLMVKNPPATQETKVPSLGWEDPMEKGMATHSSLPAWRIPQAYIINANFGPPWCSDG